MAPQDGIGGVGYIHDLYSLPGIRDVSRASKDRNPVSIAGRIKLPNFGWMRRIRDIRNQQPGATRGDIRVIPGYGYVKSIVEDKCRANFGWIGRGRAIEHAQAVRAVSKIDRGSADSDPLGIAA